MFSRPTSIALLVASVLALVATLLMGVAGAVSLRTLRSILLDDLGRDGVFFADQMAAALSQPVWNFDREQVGQILAGGLKNETVDRIEVQVVDRNGTTWVRSRPGADPAGAAGRVERRDIAAGGEKVGTVAIAFSTRLVDQRLLRYRSWMIVSAVAAGVILVGGVYFLLWRIVLRPLREIETFAARRAAGDAEGGKLRDRRYRGELESVRRSLEAMVAQLDRRHAEVSDASARLEAEQTKLRTLFRLLPTGIQIVDAEGRVLETNPAVERLFGLTSAEFAQGRHLWREYVDRRSNSMGADDLPGSRAVRGQCEIVGEEIRVSREDGSTFWASVSAAPLPQVGAVVSTVDITERKLAEDRLTLQVTELKRWQSVTQDREDRVRQLKAEINELCRRLGEPARFQGGLSGALGAGGAGGGP